MAEHDPRRGGTATRIVGAAAVFGVTLAYFLLLRNYGFQLEDEGTILFRMARIAAGGVPYADFHTVYAPGGYYLGALVLRSADEPLLMLRMVTALVNALTAATLYLLAERVAGGSVAFVPPLAWIAFMPVFPGEFASFNVPYPAWIAALAWAGAALAMLGWCERGGWGLLALAGVWAGVAFAVKPNAGAYALAASIWTIPLVAPALTGLDRWVIRGTGIAMALGVLLSFVLAWRPLEAVVLLMPVACVLAFNLGPLAERWRDVRHPRPIPALLALAGGFAFVTVLWAVPLLSHLGPTTFLREAFFVGTDAARVYSTPYPAPDLSALVVVVAVASIAAAGYALAHGVRWVRGALVALAGLGAAIAALLWRTAIMPEGLGAAIANGLEAASFWLAPLAHWGAAAILLAAILRGETADRRLRALAVVLPFAIAMYWQMYPRSDFMHVIFAVPLTAVVGAAVLARVTAWWSAGLHPRWLPPAVVAAACVVIAAARLAPALHAGRTCRAVESLRAAGSRLPLCIEHDASDDLTALGLSIDYLRRHTQAHEQILAFPALGVVQYGAQLGSLVVADYWFPGFPDNDGARDMVASLAARPPRFIVALNDGWSFFTDAPGYFTDLRTLVVARYRPVARFGRFDILARGDLLAGLGPCASWIPAGAVPPRPERRLGQRRQAGRRWMAAMTPEHARDVRLPVDEGDALLLLRTIRDGGDLAATGWLVAGYRHPNPRVRHEAIMAMGEVTKRFGAGRYRWANDLTEASYAAFVSPYQPAAAAMQREDEPLVRRFAKTLLSIPAR